MPAAIIGIDRYMKAHRQEVSGMLAAAFEGADQVKQYPEALDRAGSISAQVYKMENGAYWVKYFNGVNNVMDKQGLSVSLGGSRVLNLADNVILYGPQHLAYATYKIFGDIDHQQYPKLIPSYPSTDDAFDASYVMDVANNTSTMSAPLTRETFNADEPMAEIVGKKTVQINFETGSAIISSGQQEKLEELMNQLVIASSTKVVIHGHTDNTGTADGNMSLSEKRAFAVKQWLERKAPDAFPEGRVSVVAHGQMNPVESNSTPQGKAKNRRVEIVTGTTE
jgi:outer membrane protein OmpA-like peptidoglycan-associated protein